MKLSVAQRTIHGKKVNRLRREGLVPGVVYGSGIDHPVAIQMDKTQLVKAYEKT